MKKLFHSWLNFKKPSRIIIIIAAVVLVAALSVGFAVNKATAKPLIEMKMVYEDNPAFWFKDMKLVWDDTDYFVAHIENYNANKIRGREIGYATDEISTWRIYELKGHGRDYLLAVESDDVWRVMSSNPPEKPFRQYILENATEHDSFTKMLSVTLYNDGTARLSTPPISSFALVFPCFYSFTGNELLVKYGSGEEIARFDIADDGALIFRSATVPLYADKGARYVSGASDDATLLFAAESIAEIIERNLEIIMSSPMMSSATGNYIREHQTEYDAILDMGINALPALTDILNMGDRGLRGNIAACAVNDIIERDLLSSRSHSEWENETLTAAVSDLAKWERSFYDEQN
ncbi:MAG: hypothetical protein FWF92_09465 [Oscillospiraceae bacterium]|nr:hypothetical protein [Oscillospiraceae bacterium]